MPGLALLFDFDGTLADSLPLCLVALHAALLHHSGRHHTDQEIAANFGVSEEGIFRNLLPSDPEGAVLTYLRVYEENHHLCARPFPGIEELLASLRRRGIRLGLVTGKGRASALLSLKKLGLLEQFDGVRTGSPDGDKKAAQIRELLASFAVEPSCAAYVGDFPADVRASRAAGVRAVAAAWAPGVDLAALAAEKPDALLRTPAELSLWVEAWLSREMAPSPLPSKVR
jgi:phosphoglycolate phosphatase/pyrophosphatase PpaX